METEIIVEKDKKKGYRKLFIGFFIIMAVLTILSKVIDSVIIPKVQVNSPTAGNLSYSVVGAGVVKASETGVIDIPEGIKVDKVLSSGQKVETGQGIVFLRVSHLEEKKKELERGLAKIQLSLEREKLSGKTAAKTTEQELMAGDLAQAQKNLFDSQVKLQGAQDEYTKALEKLKKKRARDKSSEERRLLLSKEEIDKLNQVSGNQVTQNNTQAEIAYSAAIAAIDDAYDSSLEQLMKELKAAVTTVNEKLDAYNQMQYRAGLAAKNDANTSQNEKTSAQISGKTQEILKVDLDAAKGEIQRLDDLIQAGGEVKTGITGVVTKMGITPGTLTNGNEIVEIGSGKLLFLGTLQKEDVGILEEGDKIEISMPMQTKKVIGTIRNISINTGTADTQNAVNADTQGNSPEAYAEFTAELLEGDYRIGSTAEYAVNKNSQMKYPCIIPVEAVREDGNGKYCLVAGKRTTILGEEEIAVRVRIQP